MTYLNPKTGQTIGYQETSGTTAEPYTAPMLWQASTLSYVPMLADASGNLLTSGSGGGGGGNAAAGPTGSAVPAYAGYTGFNSGGNLVGVSAANPLPVAASGTITLTGGTESEGATGSAVPAYATNLGFNAAGNLVGVSSSNPLPIVGQVVTTALDETSRFDTTSTANTTYSGFAPPGSSESAAVWKITQTITAAGSPIKTIYANGSASYTNVWANRTSLSYS